MDSGIIGRPVSDGNEITSSLFTVERDGEELRRSVNVENSATTENHARFIFGTVAREDVVQYEKSQIDQEGVIHSEKATRVVAQSAEFIQVPGEFVVLESGAPTEMLDILGRVAGTAYERGEIDLDRFLDSAKSETIWMLGFEENTSNAENGTLYGNGVGEDPVFEDVMTSAAPNQLGLEHVYDGDAFKLRVSKSGYIDIFSPDLENPEFVDYLVGMVSAHLSRPTV